MASPSTATEPRWLTARRERAVALKGSLPLPSFRGNPGWEFTSLKNLDLDSYATPDPVDVDTAGLAVFEAPAGAVMNRRHMYGRRLTGPRGSGGHSSCR